MKISQLKNKIIFEIIFFQKKQKIRLFFSNFYILLLVFQK